MMSRDISRVLCETIFCFNTLSIQRPAAGDLHRRVAEIFAGHPQLGEIIAAQQDFAAGLVGHGEGQEIQAGIEMQRPQLGQHLVASAVSRQAEAAESGVALDNVVQLRVGDSETEGGRFGRLALKSSAKASSRP